MAQLIRLVFNLFLAFVKLVFKWSIDIFDRMLEDSVFGAEAALDVFHLLFASFHDGTCCADDGKSLGVLFERFEAWSALSLNLEIGRVAVEARIDVETIHTGQGMPGLLFILIAFKLTTRILLSKLILSQHALARCLIIWRDDEHGRFIIVFLAFPRGCSSSTSFRSLLCNRRPWRRHWLLCLNRQFHARLDEVRDRFELFSVVFAGFNALTVWPEQNLFWVKVLILEGVVIVLKLGVSMLVYLLQELASMQRFHLSALFVVVIYYA